MSNSKLKKRNSMIIVISIFLWIAFIVILYVGFQNRTVIEYRVEEGVVRGEKTFLESRLISILFGTLLWGILLAIVLRLSSKKKAIPEKTTKKPEGKE